MGSLVAQIVSPLFVRDKLGHSVSNPIPINLMIKKFVFFTGFALSIPATQGATTALVNFGGGTTDGTAVANTNLMDGSTDEATVALSSVVDLDGNTISGMTISATGNSTFPDKIHVNGGGANLNTSSVTANSEINSVFGGFQHAYTSSWGPDNSGSANEYTISLNGLSAGSTYTVSILSGRKGGVTYPTGMFSSWTLASGSATFNADGSQYVLWDNSENASSVIQETGTGPYTFTNQLAFNDAAMSVWNFTVDADNTNIDLNFRHPINAMVIEIIPEPSAALLGGLGLLALFRRRRR